MVRMSAEARRDQVVGIASRHFALGGYNGTSTEAIAADAGVSQPYLFRLFATKRDLFIACCHACQERVAETFTSAAGKAPEEQRFEAMGKAYMALIEDRELLLFHMQMYAACSDPVIREVVRDGYAQLVDMVIETTGAGPEEAWTFFSAGMLLNVMASLDIDALAPERDWARQWTARPDELIGLD